MELRHLRYFVAVAEELSFRRAAERLFISTPTLSQQIQALEREVGASLLLRRSQGIRLTPAGEMLLTTGKAALRAADEALSRTREVAGVQAPVLRLGLLNGVPPSLPAKVEEVLRDQVPDAKLVLTSGTTTDLLRLLDGGQVDLTLLRLPAAAPPGISTQALATEELGVIMPEGHPLAASKKVDTRDLSGLELILFPRANAPDFHDAILAQLRARGADVVLSDSEMSHAQMLSALPLRKAAISLSSARAKGTPGLAWRPFLGSKPVVTYGLAWRTSGGHPLLSALLAELLR
jgi:DNA-binding transcriptional LysR family regulator